MTCWASPRRAPARPPHSPCRSSIGSPQKPPARCKGCRVLVLSPTRELATQIAESFRSYGRHIGLTVTVVFGGVGHRPQVKALARGVDVLVATPGRLLDHSRRPQPHLGGHRDSGSRRGRPDARSRLPAADPAHCRQPLEKPAEPVLLGDHATARSTSWPRSCCTIRRGSPSRRRRRRWKASRSACCTLRVGTSARFSWSYWPTREWHGRWCLHAPSAAPTGLHGIWWKPASGRPQSMATRASRSERMHWRHSVRRRFARWWQPTLRHAASTSIR